MNRRRITRWIVAALVPVALLACLLAGALGTERGTDWLLAAVTRVEPRLQIAHRQGTLRTAEFASLEWRDAGLRVQLGNLRWRIDPACLGRGRLCVRSLTIGSLRISTTSASRKPRQPFELPALLRALDIDLDHAEVTTLTLPGGERPFALRLAARKRGATLDITEFVVTSPALMGTAHGRVGLDARLPLDLQAELRWRDTEPVTLRASGDLARLRLTASAAGPWAFTAEGEAALLADPPHATVRVRRTEPVLIGGLGTLQDIVLNLDGNAFGVDAVASAGLLSAPLGSNRLTARGRWEPGQPLRADIALDGDAGHVSAKASLDPTGTRAWTVAAALRDACPTAAWHPGLACRFSGSASASGVLATRDARVAAALDGSINDRPATVRLDAATTATATWDIRALELRAGPNALTLHGSIGPRLALDATLALPRVADILGGASGTAQGSLALSGTRAAPRLQARLDASGLRLDTWRAGTLALQADWRGAEAPDNRLRLEVAEAAFRGTAIDRLDATLAGNGNAQRLDLDAGTAFGTLTAACTGGRTAANWNGRCDTLRVNAGAAAGTWQPDQAVRLAWEPRERTLRIAAFCMRTTDATLCNDDALRIGRDAWSGVRVTGNALPARWLAQWLPASVEPLGTFGIAVRAARQRGLAPTIDATLDASRLQLMLQTAGDSLPVPLAGLNATLATRAGGTRIGIDAAIGARGHGHVALTLQGEAGGLDGRVTLQAVDVAPLLRQLPGVVDAAGTLDAAVDIGGTLAAPRVGGTLALAQGRLGHDRLPRAIDDYRVDVTFEGPQARIDGRFHSPAGTGLLRGTAAWHDGDWSAELRATAEQLSLEPRPGSVIHVVPDIRIVLGADTAAISGDIAVASADIRLDRLPETAASVSPDTVLVDATAPESTFDYTLDLRFALGERLRLRAYGADVRLGGAVRLEKPRGGSLAARGEVRVLDGAYSAYGQQLKIASGSFLFDGPLSRPQLRITALRPTEDQGVDVGLHISGDASDPQVRIFSRPTMDDHRAMHYLLTGRAPPTDGSGDVAVATALMQLGMAGSGLDTGKLFRGLGIRDFSVSTENAQRGDLRGTEVHLSGYLSPRLYVRYGISTFDKINTFRLRYRLRESLYLEAVSGLQNALDLLYIFER